MAEDAVSLLDLVWLCSMSVYSWTRAKEEISVWGVPFLCQEAEANTLAESHNAF